MARSERGIARLRAKLRALNVRHSGNLLLPSLRDNPPRVEGFAYKFTLTLPLFAAGGDRVFLHEHLAHLHELFDRRFGGCSGTSFRSSAPYFGEYLPQGVEPVRDHNTITFVYANPIDASDRFFAELKVVLREASLIPQEEILIERSEVFLV